MGTLKAEGGQKSDMDDSGCVEDESPPVKKLEENGYRGSAELLNLSDDVLLCILKYCSPLDLKALGYTCPRLATLIQDRTLWQCVDARNQPCGRARLRWMLEHCLHAGTKELLLTGYAKLAEGCQGLVNSSREEVNEAERENLKLHPDTTDRDGAEDGESSRPLEPPYPLFRQHARLHINAQPLPRFNTSPVWPEELTELENSSSPACDTATSCPGPQFTLTLGLLKQLRMQCSELTALSLDYCNINCETTAISVFPPKLKKLSLKGTKCYNLTNQSFLFKIQDCLPLLEELDVSECSWLEPAALLPLSKLRALRRLSMRDCPRLAEFVAYCALATRYGFPSLEAVDLRGSPVGDSEVSGLGWVRSLQELRVSAPAPRPPQPAHAHCRGDALPAFCELRGWEIQEPEFFKSKSNGVESDNSPENMVDPLGDNLDRMRSAEGAVCVDAKGYTLCTEGVKIVVRPREPIGDIIVRGRDGLQDEATPIERIGELAKSRVRVGEIDFRSRAEAEEARPREGARDIEDGTLERDGDIQERSERDSVTIKRRIDDGSGAVMNGEEAGPSKRARVDERSAESISEPGPSSKEPRNDDEKPKAQYVTFKRRNDFQIGKFCQLNQSSANGDEEGEGSSPKSARTDDGKPAQTQYITIKRRSDFKIDDELRKMCQSEINNGASTSKNDSSVGFDKFGSGCDRSDTKDGDENTETSKDQLDSNVSNASDIDDDVSNCSKANNRGSSPCNSVDSIDSNRPKFERYIRFRQNQDPVVIQCAPQQQIQQERDNQENNNENLQRNNENQANNGNGENQDVEPRHHILYVNVGQQLHAIYRLLPDRPHFHHGPEFLRNFHNDDLNDAPDYNVDTSTFVSDLAVSSFGRADSDSVNYIHIGQNGPVPAGGNSGIRPSRSNLRVLSMTGFRNITDRSLVHLATAAPYLRFIDFSRTNVTQRGVENFKSLRPDCEVIYSPFTDRSETNNN